MASRISSIGAAWRSRASEQSLLKLTPRWPAERRLRQLFLSAIAWSQVGGWTGWAAISFIALLLGSITFEHLTTGAILLLAVSSGCAASLGMLLTRRALKEWHVTTIYATLSTFLGAAVYLVARNSGHAAMAIALALILLPSVIALACCMARPLLFPVIVRQKSSPAHHKGWG